MSLVPSLPRVTPPLQATCVPAADLPSLAGMGTWGQGKACPVSGDWWERGFRPCAGTCYASVLPYKLRKPSPYARSMSCQGKTLGTQNPGVPGPWGTGREHSPDVQGKQSTSVPVQVARETKLMPWCRGSSLCWLFAWVPSHRGCFPAFTSSLCCVYPAVPPRPGPAAQRRCLCRGADARPLDHEGEYASASGPWDRAPAPARHFSRLAAGRE